jgi:hypothetical protein
VREDTGISYQITTSRLTPLNIYTVWAVLYLPDGKVLVTMNAGGGVALPNGSASFAGRLAVGPLPSVDGTTVVEGIAGGVFDNPRQVKVELVIRDHGPIVLAQLADQLTKFAGGCPSNTCGNVQGTIHTP